MYMYEYYAYVLCKCMKKRNRDQNSLFSKGCWGCVDDGGGVVRSAHE